MNTLKEKYKDYFKIGTAVSSRTIVTHEELIKTHFNSITCENEMKFINLHSEKEKYNFEDADKIYDFAKENEIALRGHTFMWHNQTPEWVFHNADRQTLLNRFKEHVTKVSQRYADTIYCWDVVNEAIEDRSNQILRQTKWLEIIGEDYMDCAFTIAKEVLPHTDLYYNDYNETNKEKSAKIYDIVKGMKERNVPIDGIGLQCHFNIFNPTMDELKKSIEMYAKLGLKLQITEMDVSVFAFEDRQSVVKPTKEMYEAQAKVYEESFKIFRAYKDVIDSVTLWGVADDVTWLDGFPVRNRKNWPLLFDEKHEPKEAFERIMNW